MPSSVFDAVGDLPAMSYLPDMAKLLSASSYPHIPSKSPAAPALDERLYGGFFVAESADEAEEEEDDFRPKKKPRPSKADGSKSTENDHGPLKRQRGRPKVSTKDETAAERRRTQIRLAQRAYRNRKENTISDLTQKVETLQAAMKTVNTGFARLRESLLNTGLVHNNSAVARQVDDLMQQISEAIDTPASDADKTSEEEDGGSQAQDLRRDPTQPEQMGRNIPPVALQGQRHPLSSRPAADIHSALLGFGADDSISAIAGPNLTDLQNYPALPTNYPTSSAFRTATSQTSATNPLALTSVDRFPHKYNYTYSFQETTFARRLQRLCIERAYQRLLSPHVDPDWLLRTFRFTFNFSSKERIINVFKNILARGTDEPLENWRTPFIHIGGAGLHFPRRDDYGRPVYPPNLLDPVRAASAWRIPNPETEPPADSVAGIIEAIGFDGDWYDSHDVEEYLKTKGICPDPQSSFVVVDSSRIHPPSLPETETAGTLTSGSSPRSQTSGPASLELNSHGVTETRNEFDLLLSQEEAGPMTGSLTEDWLGQQKEFDAGDFDMELPHPSSATTARTRGWLTIEIETFMERLADEGVCLGRAPGFRKISVDKALALAMQEAF